MKTISEKSMLILAALTLGLIIAWLIGSDQNPDVSPSQVSVDTGIATRSDSTAP